MGKSRRKLVTSQRDRARMAVICTTLVTFIVVISITVIVVIVIVVNVAVGVEEGKRSTRGVDGRVKPRAIFSRRSMVVLSGLRVCMRSRLEGGRSWCGCLLSLESC